MRRGLMLPTLDELAQQYGTDKASGWHGYTLLYERYLGSQDDPEFLDAIAYGHRPAGWAIDAWRPYGPFDLIIDDASHLSGLTIASFKALYKHLKPGGLYVVEDVHTSYADWFYGPEHSNAIPGCDAVSTPTTMQFLKRLADEVQFDPHGTYRFPSFKREHWLGYDLDWLHFYRDIVFMRKRIPGSFR
jgi:hypothetical protein